MTHEVDPNVIAVQWGLLGVFGVVVALMLAPTEKHVLQFQASADETDRRRAARWSRSTRLISLAVLLGLIGLSGLGAFDAGLRWWGNPNKATFLLLTPIAAQLGFTIAVYSLVKRVGKVLGLQLEGPSWKPSAGGLRPSAALRLVNETPAAIQFCWIDFDGNEDAKIRGTIPPYNALTQKTFEGHRFLIKNAEEQDVGVAVAGSGPCKVIIRSSPDDLEKEKED